MQQNFDGGKDNGLDCAQSVSEVLADADYEAYEYWQDDYFYGRNEWEAILALPEEEQDKIVYDPQRYYMECYFEKRGIPL